MIARSGGLSRRDGEIRLTWRGRPSRRDGGAGRAVRPGPTTAARTFPDLACRSFFFEDRSVSSVSRSPSGDDVESDHHGDCRGSLLAVRPLGRGGSRRRRDVRATRGPGSGSTARGGARCSPGARRRGVRRQSREHSGGEDATRCSPMRSPISAGCRRRWRGSTDRPVRRTVARSRSASAATVLIGSRGARGPAARAGSAPGPGVLGTGTGRRMGRGTRPVRGGQRCGDGDARRGGGADVGVAPAHAGPAAREAIRRRPSPSRSARSSDGSSPPEPARSRTWHRAFAGWVGSRSGRWSSPPVEPWFRSCVSESAAAGSPAALERRSRCAGCRHWSTLGAATTWPTRCPAPCSRSIRASTPAPSLAPRSPAWSTRSVATVPVGSKSPRRRRPFAPRPT